MRQRAKLAGAIAHDPDLLVLDEPFNGLDPVARHDLVSLVRGWATTRSLIVASHLPWESDFSRLPTVFLARSPGDVVVSRFHHMTRHEGKFDGSLAEFAGDPEHGIPDLIAYLATWQPHLEDPNVIAVTYERLKADPVAAFGELVTGLGIQADPEELAAALEAASVDRMRKVEAESGVGQPQAYDFEDPDARRVRKARVGGWREEMDDDTIALLIAEIESQPAARELLEGLDLMPGPAAV